MNEHRCNAREERIYMGGYNDGYERGRRAGELRSQPLAWWGGFLAGAGVLTVLIVLVSVLR